MRQKEEKEEVEEKEEMKEKEEVGKEEENEEEKKENCCGTGGRTDRRVKKSKALQEVLADLKSGVSGIHTWARQRSPTLLLFQNQALLPEAHLGPGRRKS